MIDLENYLAKQKSSIKTETCQIKEDNIKELRKQQSVMDKEKEAQFEYVITEFKELSKKNEFAPKFTRLVKLKHKTYLTKWEKNDYDVITKDRLRKHGRSEPS